MSPMTGLYAALAALLAAGIWIVARSGNPAAPHDGSGDNPKPSRPLTRREQLLKERARVRWQLSIGAPRSRVNDAGVKDDLHAILGEIDAELAETPPEKPSAWRNRARS